MFYNFKIVFRSLWKGGIYSVINIGGLAIGMVAAMLIMLWVYNQWSYDRFHEKDDRLYQAINYSGQYGSMPNNSRLLGPTLKNDYSEVANIARINHWKETCAFGDKKLNAEAAFADPSFLQIFSFPLIAGDAKTAINEPHSAVLTESFARRLFGNDNPVGKTIILRAKQPLTVTGIMADLPANTKFEFDVLFPQVLMKDLDPYYNEERWGNYETFTYVELQPGANVASLNETIRDIVGQHTDGGDKTQTVLQPVSQWHLYTKWENGQAVGGRIDTLRLFSVIALLVLLIACINFINLSTARSARQAKEVGIRKVVGAGKYSLIKQFLGESMLIAATSAIIALAVVYLLIPFFNNLMKVELNFAFGNIWFYAALLVVVLITGLLAGSYPAFYLSSFIPIKVLKGLMKTGTKGSVLRKTLIVMQFTCAIVLIVSTVVIHRQIRHAENRNSEYNKDHLVFLKLTEQMDKHQAQIRNDLISSGAALSVTRTLSPMTESWNSTWGIGWKGKNPENKTPINRFYVDTQWAETTGITILQGRDIDINTYPTDSTALLLTESTVKLMEFENPIGEMIKDRRKEWHVVGVVKDFIIDSPYEPIRPMIIGGPGGFFGCMYVKLNGARPTADNLAKVEEVMKQYNSDFPFEYQFVDETYARKFAEEQRTGILALSFAILAIFISCLGLFGLSAYMAETRRKEIGVRKVLGASISDIATLLNREFITLVLVSFIIASPIAWWTMNKWLSGYAYHTNIPWWVFAAVALLTIGITLFTVSFQALKAATTNPVKSLKTE